MATFNLFLKFNENLMKGKINDLSSSLTSIKVALLTASAVINQTINDNWGDLVSYEASGTGYTAGGQALSNIQITLDTTNKRVYFKANNVLWENISISFRYVVIYDATPSNNSDKKLIGYADFGSEQTVSGSNLEIQFNTNGIFYYQV